MDTSSTNELDIFSLPNELHDYILSFLGLSDLKKLRLTCSHFNNVVVESSVFREISKILINHKNVLEVAESIRQNNNRIRFRNAQFLNVDDEKFPEVAFIMDAIAMSVKQLELGLADNFETLTSVELPSLERLYIAVLECKNFANWKLNKYKHLNSVYNASCFDSPLNNHILQELQKFQAGKMKNLRVICGNETSVLNVLKLNAQSLTYLDIHFLEHTEMQFRKEWNSVFQKMNALKSLRLSSYKSADDWIDVTLKALPETAQLDTIAIDGNLELSDELLLFIARKYQKSLRSANFCGNQDITSRGFQELLLMARNLRKLDISFHRILNSESFGLDRKVMLQQLDLTCSKLTENCICRLAENLTNLVVLKLKLCECCTDKALAYIFRYQTLLKTLILAHCYQITDLGLMGLGEKEWPIPMPISRLEHLESLNLNQVTKLTNKPFCAAMAFKKLHFIELGGNDQITNEAIECLTRNCPSIEKLYLHRCTKITADVFDIMAINMKNLSEFFIQSSRHGRIEGKDDFRKHLKLLKEKY